ncbi:hypothetical protein [Pannonibacter tanglangensis]|uniref:Uncharacterized protein n=1 Tax=Pannonibacter tanglangensis TaxID=2750084 RepID=A0ABW9ZBJ3_9HYPH|nr:hypothetical protein [Pannonibacter sp. XCT-34]NBN62200.1 hypothetical protein [Pannonibacter sp. XCT-34]
MTHMIRFFLPSAPVLAWLAAIGGFIALIGVSAAQIDSLTRPLPAPEKAAPVSRDPYGCLELEFLGEDPACAPSRAPLPEPGPVAGIGKPATRA